MERLPVSRLAYATVAAFAVAGCSGAQHDPLPATPQSAALRGGERVAAATPATCPSAWNPKAKLPTGLTSAVGGIGTVGLPVTIVNDSGFPDTSVFLYATAQNDVMSKGNNESGYYYYLDTDGSLKYFNGTATHAPGFQLSCFPGSIPGKTGARFVIPAAASGGRLWIAIAPVSSKPGPGSNPLPLLGSAGGEGTFQGPAPWNGTPTWKNVLFDVVEFALAPAIVPNYDLTQVDFIGLPLKVQPEPSGSPIGIDETSEPALVDAFANDPNFKDLLYYSTIDGKRTLTRIYNPSHAGAGIAPALTTYFEKYVDDELVPAFEANMDPKSPSYHTMWTTIEPLMTGVPLNPAPLAYYAGFNAASQSFEYEPCAAAGCTKGGKPLAGSPNITFSKWWVWSPNVFQDNQGKTPTTIPSYYLLKALTTDLNRGVALVPGEHPAAPSALGKYYANAVHNDFSQIVHAESINDTGYGFAWDDCCGSFAQSNDYTLGSGVKGITITIGRIPN
jgi:hypothetical protein